jgi:hypothetical protein
MGKKIGEVKVTTHTCSYVYSSPFLNPPLARYSQFFLSLKRNFRSHPRDFFISRSMRGEKNEKDSKWDTQKNLHVCAHRNTNKWEYRNEPIFYRKKNCVYDLSI